MKITMTFEIPDNGDCEGCPFLASNSEYDECRCSRFDGQVLFRLPNTPWYEKHFRPLQECENKAK